MITDSERGSIAPLVPIIMFALLILGGLVVDGSKGLNARGNAQAYAEEAARAGASAIMQDQPGLVLDKSLAEARVHAYCVAVTNTTHANVRVRHCDVAGTPFTATKEPTCDGTKPAIVVNVVVTVETDTSLLGLVGFSHFDETAHASARPYEGVNAADRC